MILPPSFPDPPGGDAGSGSWANAHISPVAESEIVLDLLSLINRDDGLHELIRDVTLLVQNWTGCEAVGIRLRDGEDFPYFETIGFPPEHVHLENSLCAVDQAGEIVRDSTGNPVLECMCGNVLTGRFDPSLPFFTESGTFWTNSTSELLASTSEEDRQARTRNRCNGEGYESVLLAPVRHGSQTLGLLQLNDSRKGFFSLELVQVLERLASNLGIGLVQREQAQSLRDREQELAAIYSHIPQATLLMDQDRKVRSANSSAAAITGFLREELRGKREGEALGCLHHLDDPRGCGFGPECEHCVLHNILLATLRTGKDFYQREAELPVSKANLRHTVTLLFSSKLLHIKGEPNVLVTLEDISERKRTEKALHESEERFKVLLERLPGGVFAHDLDGRIVFVNNMASINTGYTKEELLNMTVSDIDPESVERKDDIRFWHRLRYGESAVFESIHVRKDGSRYPAEIHLNAVELQGRPVLLPIVLDITERKQMEKQVSESNLFQTSVLDNIPYNIAVLDKQGNIIYVNQHWKKFAKDNGVTPNEVSEGSNYISVCLRATGEDADSAMSFVEGLNEVMSGKRDFYSLEYPCHSPEEQRWFICQITPFLEEPPRRVTVGHANITEHKQMEEKLKQMSFQDSLTGLYNRNFFEEEMTRLSDSRYSPLGIIVCDLDGMKLVNDTLGHQAGDRMLINTANILRQSFRSSDIIARIGGDEFAVLLPQTGPEKVERMLQRLRGAVRKFNNHEPELPLALSMGHAVSNTTGDLHALFREADNLMYREKIQQEGSQRNAILQALTKTMQARDFDTEGHCDRLQELAVSLAHSLNLSQDVVNDLSLLARFHDLGKVGTPDHILFKRSSLTEEERRQMRQHCEVGHRIASSVSDLEPIADYILKHHERWDGHGYPMGLSGKDIPLHCRILTIVDAYDAMTSDRPYRNAMSQHEAIQELRRYAGTQFDPDLVERFIQILDQDDQSE